MLSTHTAPSLHARVHHVVGRAPQIVDAQWTLDDHALTLSCPRTDDDAWVQLGAIVEAVAVSLGMHVEVESLVRRELEPQRTVLALTPSPMAGNERLAACLDRRAHEFKTPVLRVAAHVPARLAAAAAFHGCVLHWFDMAALESAGDSMRPPPGACALAILEARHDDRDGLIRGGRAACRVWLEANSLGLAIDPAAARLRADDTPRAIVLLWLGS